MMSPFTRTMTRSRSSAPPCAASRVRPRTRRRTGLGRLRLRDGFMVHLGPGQEAPDEFLDTALRLLLEEKFLDLLARLFEAGQARLLARIHAQHVMAERAHHHLA